MILKIDGRPIGAGQRTFVIAEIGVNHDGSLERALQLVQHAAAAGADAVKLQVFRASRLMHPSSVMADYQLEQTDQTEAAEMLRAYELSDSAIRTIVDAIRAQGLTPLATPFSPADVDVIEEMDLPAIKIASPDLVNRVLLERAARNARPMIVSTGAATIAEVEKTVDWLNAWQTPFALMHCVSSYPTPAYQAHLSWIAELARFGVPVGYSDHTTALLAGGMSVTAGGCIVEKHLTYDRTATGPDHAASANPLEFQEYVRVIRSAEALRGSVGKHVLPIEQEVRRISRQSLVLLRDIAPGELITRDDLTVQRPGTGIAPADVALAAGCTARMHLCKGTLLEWDMLSDAA